MSSDPRWPGWRELVKSIDRLEKSASWAHHTIDDHQLVVMEHGFLIEQANKQIESLLAEIEKLKHGTEYERGRGR